jgi:DNA-binding MarR family transcriptional regulator
MPDRASSSARAEAGDMLVRLVTPLGGHLGAVSAQHGLTPMQAMLLDRIDEGAALPMTELARELRCDTSNLTGLADRLEERGLVERVTPREDRRVRALALTAKGRALRRALSRDVREGNPMLERLSAAECATLATLLARLIGDKP